MVRHEPKTLSDRPHRRAVGALAAAAPGRRARRPPAQRRPARSGQWPAVCAAHGVSVAPPAARPPSLGHRVGVLPPLAGRWHPRTGARRTAGAGPPRRRARPPAQCGQSRLADREDGRKRGARGYDAGKKIKGRKRHLVVDTLGLIHGLRVHAADVQDRDGAKLVLAPLLGRLPRLERLWADGAYAGQLVDWVHDQAGWTLEIVKRPEEARGFV